MELKFYGDTKNGEICNYADIDFKHAYEGRYFDIYSYKNGLEDILNNNVKDQTFYTNGGRPFKADGWVIPNDIYETWKTSDGRFLTLKMPWSDVCTFGIEELRDQFAQFNECKLVYLKSIKVPEWFCKEVYE